MIVIVCLDKKNGMLFNNRRQSEDRILRENVIKMCGEKKLWMNPYSGKQFQHFADKICVSDNFLEEAENGDYCFVEDCSLKPYSDNIEQIIVYHWNREYPSDKKIDIDLKKWKQVSKEDFKGSSHEKITKEVLLP